MERELLGFLAVRLGAELGRPRKIAAAMDPRISCLEISEGFLRVLSLAIAGRGITHTLNNLLGGQLLNAELAAREGVRRPAGNEYLERVVMASRKGAVIARRLSDLTGWEEGQRDFIPFGPIVEEAVHLVHDLYEANRVEVHGGDCSAVVWADPRLLHSMVLAMVAPAVELMGPEMRVVLEVSFVEQESVVHLDVALPGPPVDEGSEEGWQDGLQLGLALASRVASLHGGRLESPDPENAGRKRIVIRASLPED